MLTFDPRTFLNNFERIINETVLSSYANQKLIRVNDDNFF